MTSNISGSANTFRLCRVAIRWKKWEMGSYVLNSVGDLCVLTILWEENTYRDKSFKSFLSTTTRRSNMYNIITGSEVIIYTRKVESKYSSSFLELLESYYSRLFRRNLPPPRHRFIRVTPH